MSELKTLKDFEGMLAVKLKIDPEAKEDWEKEFHKYVKQDPTDGRTIITLSTRPLLEELRQEAIKWVKELYEEGKKYEKRTSVFYHDNPYFVAKDKFLYFFNLTEEDLKDNIEMPSAQGDLGSHEADDGSPISDTGSPHLAPKEKDIIKNLKETGIDEDRNMEWNDETEELVIGSGDNKIILKKRLAEKDCVNIEDICIIDDCGCEFNEFGQLKRCIPHIERKKRRVITNEMATDLAKDIARVGFVTRDVDE